MSTSLGGEEMREEREGWRDRQIKEAISIEHKRGEWGQEEQPCQRRKSLRRISPEVRSRRSTSNGSNVFGDAFLGADSEEEDEADDDEEGEVLANDERAGDDEGGEAERERVVKHCSKRKPDTSSSVSRSSAKAEARRVIACVIYSKWECKQGTAGIINTVERGTRSTSCVAVYAKQMLRVAPRTCWEAACASIIARCKSGGRRRRSPEKWMRARLLSSLEWGGSSCGSWRNMETQGRDREEEK